MKILVYNIKILFQVSYSKSEIRRGPAMKELPLIENAFLLCEDDKIVDLGRMEDIQGDYFNSTVCIDAAGKLVLPGWCDPHTHLVFAGSREGEFIDKIRGFSYEEIAKRGGGILNSAKTLHNTTEEDLFQQSARRVREIMKLGTCAVEIKSGYGLSTEDELKMLRVIRMIKNEFPLRVKATFLGAHAIPAEFINSREKYIHKLIAEMIPAVASENLADFIDVFCDTGFFTPEETSAILEAGAKYGLRPKIHANELGFSGGIQRGVENKALSVDHLEFTGEEEINILLSSSTIPTVLPGASFFLGLRYAPARMMIDSGLPLALATDFNPGSSPSGNMNFIFSLACIKLRLLPEEALNAMTVNSAAAMDVLDTCGTIGKGKDASFIITTEIRDLSSIPYSFGSSQIEKVCCRGTLVI
jgi:imidazolonepropionase